MSLLEDGKRIFEKVTGYARPGADDLRDLVRSRKPHLFHFKDDGRTPNNPHLPLILYRSPVRLTRHYDPAAIFEDIFASHGWGSSWRNGIFDFLHFHTKTHEVLGIARGHVAVQFGGMRGRRIDLKEGDVVVLPAGTGHKRLSQSRDLLVVGAYPQSGEYDEPRPSEIDHEQAVSSIAKVKLPRTDPVFGRNGPLLQVWHRRAKA